jgi:hypothetical protein
MLLTRPVSHEARAIGDSYEDAMRQIKVLANPNGVMRHRHYRGIVTEIEGSTPADDAGRAFARRSPYCRRA